MKVGWYIMWIIIVATFEASNFSWHVIMEK